MTLVSSFVVSGHTFLLGDALISRTSDCAVSPLHLPTIGDISEVFPPGSGFIPVELCQKILLVNPGMAVGWSGSRVYAKSVLSDVVTEFRNRSPGQQELDKRVSEILGDNGIGAASGLALFFHLQVDSPTTGTYRSVTGISGPRPSETSVFHSVYMLGSGSETVLEYMARAEPLEGRDPDRDAITASLGLSGYLLHMEMTTRLSLLHYFGGIIEVAGPFARRDEITKCSDVTYILLYVYTGGGRVGIVTEQFLAMRPIYRDDVLWVYVHRATIEKGRRSEAYVVQPAFRQLTPEDFPPPPWPNFNATYMSAQVVFLREDGTPTANSFVDLGTDRLWFETNSNGTVNLTIAPEFGNLLRRLTWG